MVEGIVTVTDNNFEKEVLKSDVPVMLDFWATWCPPCKMIAPTIDELAKDYKDKLKVGKIDVDENGQIATQLSVMNIPTIIFFKDGKEHKRMVGINPKGIFEKEIKHLIGK